MSTWSLRKAAIPARLLVGKRRVNVVRGHEVFPGSRFPHLHQSLHLLRQRLRERVRQTHQANGSSKILQNKPYVGICHAERESVGVDPRLSGVA